MASNYVEVKIKASDEAKPDLEALKFDLESIGHKIETAKVEVDDKDAAAKLLSLNARLADLNHKVSNPRLSTAGAAKVEAQIASIDAALDHLNDKHADPKVVLEGAEKVLAEVALLDHEIDKLDRKADGAGSTGLIGKLLEGAGGGLSSILSKDIPLIGTSVQTFLVLSPAIAAVATELVAVGSGFAAAGAGAGAFYLLAKPAISQVTAAYSGLHAAQQKYQNALALDKLDPTKSHATAVKAALDQLKLAQQAIGKLPGSEQQAIMGLQKLTAEFGAMSKAFAPEAFKVFAAGLGLIQKLLPDIVPFANTFANVLTKLLNQASKFAGSKGFADWLKQFHSIEGPALNAIGQGIGNVAVAIGKLMTSMSGKDIAHAINIAFGAVSGTINAVTTSVKFLMQFWDGAGIAFTTGAHAIASSFDSIRHGAASMAAAVASNFDAARHAVASWVSAVASAVAQVVSFFASLPGRIMSALGNLANVLFNVGKSVIEGLIRGIESMIPGLQGEMSKVGGIVKSVAGFLGIKSPSTVMHGYGVNIMDGLMGGMRSRFPSLRSQMADVAAMIGNPMANGVTAMNGIGGRGGGQLQLQVAPGGGSAFEQFMVLALRNYVRVRGGNVQSVIGH